MLAGAGGARHAFTPLLPCLPLGLSVGRSVCWSGWLFGWVAARPSRTPCFCFPLASALQAAKGVAGLEAGACGADVLAELVIAHEESNERAALLDKVSVRAACA